VHAGNPTVLVLLNSSSTDPKYSTHSVVAAVTNRDIYWPAVTSVSPTVIPLSGCNATLIGSTFLDRRKPFVARPDT
jgi:hypothetical protein